MLMKRVSGDCRGFVARRKSLKRRKSGYFVFCTCKHRLLPQAFSAESVCLAADYLYKMSFRPSTVTSGSWARPVSPPSVVIRKSPPSPNDRRRVSSGSSPLNRSAEAFVTKVHEGLFRRVKEVTEHAKQSGALFSIESTPYIVQDGGVEFVVRVAKALEKKPAGNRDLALSSQDPFAEPEPELTVMDLTPTHRLLLNKYNVVDYHLLIVTTDFEHQTDFLNTADLHAATLLMQQVDGLLFYNSGDESGASQPHKHLQFIPLPLNMTAAKQSDDCTTRDLPIEALVAASCVVEGQVFQLEPLPFEHYVCKLEQHVFLHPEQLPFAAAYLERVYRCLLECSSLRLMDEQARRSGELSYNLLVTRRWMLLVVRRKERFGNVSVNSLGFAGTLLVKTESVLKELLQAGPMRVLSHVAAERPQTYSKTTPAAAAVCRIKADDFFHFKKTQSLPS